MRSNLIQSRRKKGLTQQALADKILITKIVDGEEVTKPMSRSYLANIERGSQAPMFGIAEKIGKVLLKRNLKELFENIIEED